MLLFLFVLFCYVLLSIVMVFTPFLCSTHLPTPSHSLPFTPPVSPLYPALHTLYLPYSNATLQLPIPTVLHYTVSFLIKRFLSSLPLCSCECSPILGYQSGLNSFSHGPPLSLSLTAPTNTLPSIITNLLADTKLLTHFTPTHCRIYISHCGYRLSLA